MVIDMVRVKILFWVAVAMAVGLMGFISYHYVLVGSLKSELKDSRATVGQLTVELATIKTNRDQLKKALEDQTKEVQKFIQAAKDASDAASEAWKAEQKRAATWRSKYEEVINAPPIGDSCTAVQLKLDRYVKTRLEEAQ